jgi:hypothetical protein
VCVYYCSNNRARAHIPGTEHASPGGRPRAPHAAVPSAALHLRGHFAQLPRAKISVLRILLTVATPYLIHSRALFFLSGTIKIVFTAVPSRLFPRNSGVINTPPVLERQHAVESRDIRRARGRGRAHRAVRRKPVLQACAGRRGRSRRCHGPVPPYRHTFSKCSPCRAFLDKVRTLTFENVYQGQRWRSAIWCPCR